MADFKSCGSCAHIDKSRRPWRCRLGHSTKGSQWFAKCESWERKGTQKKEQDK